MKPDHPTISKPQASYSSLFISPNTLAFQTRADEVLQFIHERDVHVPKVFLDTYEENEPWHLVPDPENRQASLPFMSTNSISCFSNMCTLSEICGDIMSRFYAVKASKEPISTLVEERNEIRQRLSNWSAELPDVLKFAPWSDQGPTAVPLHVTILHTVHLSLIILLERPFVANGHLNREGSSATLGSWGACTVAAEKIAHHLRAYKENFTFQHIQYQLCYAIYVASTVLVRNANSSTRTASLPHLRVCLQAFEEMKMQHPGAVRMEKKIRSLMSRLSVEVHQDSQGTTVPNSVFDQMTLPRTAPLTESDIDVDLDALIQTFDYGADEFTQQQDPFMLLDAIQSSGTPSANADWMFGDPTSDADLLFGALREP